MKIAIEHTTALRCDPGAPASTQLLRLTPRNTGRQRVLSWELSLPRPASRDTDAWGNVQHVLTLDAPGREVVLSARGVVEIGPASADDDGLNPLLFLRPTTLTQADAALADFADNFRMPQVRRDVLRALMVAVADQVTLAPAPFAGGSAADAFARRSGSCHDQAHVFIACARHLGVPARYVSGYVHAEGRDRVASHGWVELHAGDQWHTFDIAHRLDHPTTHLALAIGMDYLDACPVRGVRVAGTREQVAATLLAQARQSNQ